MDILRIAAYQLVFLDRIPARAAVDEAVEQTKKGSPKAAGLVNAVLRRIAERVGTLPEPSSKDLTQYLAIKYSHPAWLVQRFIDELGGTGAEALLQANNADTPLYAQVNTLKTDAAQVIGALHAESVEASLHPWVDNCLVLEHSGNPTRLKPFQSGEIYIQDPAAKLAAEAADVRAGMRLLDTCAAPGGKSFAAGIRMGNQGEILACDISEKKLAKIEEGAERLGLSILQTRGMDARVLDPDEVGTFDVVIVDAPCSGLGIIRKKPEIRDKTQEEIRRLPEIQLEILQGAAKCVAPGGVLLYATCTILAEENGGIVGAFLEGAKDFAPEAFTLPGEIGVVPGGQITLYPHIHGTDGFFFCKMRRSI